MYLGEQFLKESSRVRMMVYLKPIFFLQGSCPLIAHTLMVFN